MFRALLFAFLIGLPFGLAYLFGFWVPVALAVVACLCVVFSNGKARGAEENQGGMLTGYGTTTSAADL